ncbi:MAG: PIG-L family deacetylase [Synergistales bacterium]|nr:PIG-L family deacetylase [Synergistales bacterium]
MRVLVIAPHPDDEVLGVGGTIARFAEEGAHVAVAIVTKGEAGMFDPALIERGRTEAKQCHLLLGVGDTRFLDFPAARLDTVEHHVLNRAFVELIEEVRPDKVFLPFVGDIHNDHRVVFESALVALRPASGAHRVTDIFCYETLSETNWNAPCVTPRFAPNVFVDISPYLDTKLKAAAVYASQMKEFPHERSLEAISCLAKLRGATIGVSAAEAFVQVRRVV